MKDFNIKKHCNCGPAPGGVRLLLSKLRGMTPKERAAYLRKKRIARGF